MKDEKPAEPKKVSRPELIELLNQDLAREYQAIIAYVVYSQVIKGAAYMNIAGELEKHAAEELGHAIIIAKQIDYLGGSPTVQPKPVRTSEKATDMLEFDLANETETIHQLPRPYPPVRSSGRIPPERADHEILHGRTGPPDLTRHRPGTGTSPLRTAPPNLAGRYVHGSQAVVSRGPGGNLSTRPRERSHQDIRCRDGEPKRRVGRGDK